MDESLKSKLLINIAASWKMHSVQFVAFFSTAVSALGAWFLSLPADCAPLLAKGAACTTSQLSILNMFSVPAAIVPLIAGAVTWWLRVKPQTNITPAVAAAKSADASQPPAENS